MQRRPCAILHELPDIWNKNFCAYYHSGWRKFPPWGALPAAYEQSIEAVGFFLLGDDRPRQISDRRPCAVLMERLGWVAAGSQRFAVRTSEQFA